MLDHNMIQKTVAAAEKYGAEQKRETDMFNDIYNLIENTMINIENGTGGEEKPKPPTPEEPEDPRKDLTEKEKVRFIKQ